MNAYDTLPPTGVITVRTLPPLQPINIKITHEGRLPSTWRAPVGKLLTNRRIAEYQREGKYGPALKLAIRPDAQPCCVKGCNSRVNTKRIAYEYLPAPGYYCSVHRLKYREAMLKEREDEKRWKEARLQQYQ